MQSHGAHKHFSCICKSLIGPTRWSANLIVRCVLALSFVKMFAATLLFVLCLGIVFLGPDARDARADEVWRWQNPRPTGFHLKAIAPLDARRFWIGGENSTVYFRKGKSWARHVLPVAIDVRGMAATDENHAWAVGGVWVGPALRGAVLFYDGDSWRQLETPECYMLESVAALDPNHVWAVGLNEVLFWDGGSWTKTVIGASYDSLLAVTAIDSTHVWAVGASGAIFL